MTRRRNLIEALELRIMLTVFEPANGSAFQTALNQAQLGDTIKLTANTTYTGWFSLPNKTSGSGWITITSSAGLVGSEFAGAYAASKFALEGWMESLRYDVEPYGITTTIVEPGFFRTELLVEGASSIWPELTIDDYAERTASTIAFWKSMNGQQGGDPAKLAAALVTIAGLEQPPLRWLAGADAVATAEQKANELLTQADAHRELSSSLDFDTTAV